MIINNNLSARFATRELALRGKEINKEMEGLSSGMRINRAGDDAAGLAVSEKMRAQIRGLNRASRNVQEGISFIQATEGYLAETTNVINRIRELSIQAANGVYSSDDRKLIQIEVAQLVDEIDRVAQQAQFNGFNMLTGRFSAESGSQKVQFHIGANVDQFITTNIENMTASALGLTQVGEQLQAISVANTEDANRSIARLDSALQIVVATRANLGAIQSRLNYLQQGLDIASENMQAAESQIRDTDMAKAMTDFVRARILTQSSTAMIAQANAQPNTILQLLNR